mgnify:CR=1 FL=1
MTIDYSMIYDQLSQEMEKIVVKKKFCLEP